MGFASYNEALLAWLTPPVTVPMVVDDAVVSVEPDELLPLLEQLLAGPAQIIWATRIPPSSPPPTGWGPSGRR